MNFKNFFFVILLCAFFQTSFAWNAKGHMIVAAISWSELDKESQTQITNILIQHPEYERVWKKMYRKHKNDFPLGKFLMMQAAIWPDAIRTYSHPQSEFHRAEWHFITYKVDFGNGHTSEMPLDEDKKGNIVFAINHARNMIADIHTPEDERAMYLSWLIHLVGDVHQPLHCASLFNEDFKKGDRGGNKFYIKPRTAGVKLHSFWDGSLGTTKNPRSASNDGTEISVKYPIEGFDLSEKDCREWSVVSFKEAISEAYLDGNLKYSIEKTKAVSPPLDYGKNTKSVAERNVALAGYRLTKDILSLL